MPVRWALLIIVLTIFCTNLSAQRKFVPGFVMTANGEQKWGYVSYDDVLRGHNVFFKNTLKDPQTVKYDIMSIKGFIKITDRDTIIYEKAVVKYREIKSVQVGVTQALVNDSVKDITDTLFLQLIVGGKLSLFYKQGIRSCFFYRTKGQPDIKELNLRTYLEPQHKGGNNTNRLYYRSLTNYYEYVTVNEYELQLQELMADCPAVLDKIRKTAYKLTELRKLVTEYNNCNDGIYYTSYRKKRPTTATLIIDGGFNCTWLKFKGPLNGLENTKFKNGPGYVANIGVKLNLNEISRRVGLRLEMGVKGYKINGVYKYSPSSFINYTLTSSFNLLYIKWAVLPEFKLGNLNSNYQPYVNFGFAAGYMVKAFTNSQHKEGRVHTPVNTTGPALDEIRKSEFGLVLSAGIRIHRYAGLELRYEYSNGLSPYKYLPSYANSLMVKACFFY